MTVIPSHFQIDQESVRYQSLTKLSELTDQYVGYRRLNSKESQKLLLQLTQIRIFLRALDFSEYLTYEQRYKIVFALADAADIYEFPTAPVLANVNRPAILIGSGGNTTTVTNNFNAGTPFENSDVDAGTETVDTFATSLGSGVVWHYTVSNGTAQRSGIFVATWTGASIDGTETSTPDVGGATDDIVLSVDISAGNARLRATAASNNWSISGRRYLINNG